MEDFMPPEDPLKALSEQKPPARETPLPDMLIYREIARDDGTPEVVALRLKELKAEREKIAEMWNAEGKTRVFVPNTPQARKMKLQAKLHNRAEAKHAEIVKKELTQRVRPIEMPKDAVVIKAVEL